MSKPVTTVSVWDGRGTARSFELDMDKRLKSRIYKSMETASKLKQERLTSSSVGKVISSIEKHGTLVGQPLPTYDIDDAVGLMGEMITQEFSKSQGFESLFAKWESGGTSKSRGIDLVVRRFERAWELRLLEAKHLHESVKGIARGACSQKIQRRFADGLDEFEQERTLINLAAIIVKLSGANRVSRAAGTRNEQLEEVFRFLLSQLVYDRYSLEVVACIDAKYCDEGTLKASVRSVVNPVHVGDHSVCLTLLEIDHSENTTERICEDYVGSKP